MQGIQEKCIRHNNSTTQDHTREPLTPARVACSRSAHDKLDHFLSFVYTSHKGQASEDSACALSPFVTKIAASGKDLYGEKKVKPQRGKGRITTQGRNQKSVKQVTFSLTGNAAKHLEPFDTHSQTLGDTKFPKF